MKRPNDDFPFVFTGEIQDLEEKSKSAKTGDDAESDSDDDDDGCFTMGYGGDDDNDSSNTLRSGNKLFLDKWHKGQYETLAKNLLDVSELMWLAPRMYEGQPATRLLMEDTIDAWFRGLISEGFGKDMLVCCKSNFMSQRLLRRCKSVLKKLEDDELFIIGENDESISYEKKSKAHDILFSSWKGKSAFRGLGSDFIILVADDKDEDDELFKKFFHESIVPVMQLKDVILVIYWMRYKTKEDSYDFSVFNPEFRSAIEDLRPKK